MNSIDENKHEPASRAQLSGNGDLGASLLFPVGARPSVRLLEELFGSFELSSSKVQVSHRPGEDEGWLEILASGLTFEVRGLSPAEPAAGCHADHRYGFVQDLPDEPLESVELLPGPHAAGGGGLLPVARALAGLAANLALNLPVAAVAWHSAATWLEPRYFSRTVMNWLAGGTFPAPGLIALLPASDGGISSNGLAHFTGQEIQMAAAPGETQEDTTRLAARAVDRLVRRGKVIEAEEIGGAGVRLLAEPSQFSNLVWIWRK